VHCALHQLAPPARNPAAPQQQAAALDEEEEANRRSLPKGGSWEGDPTQPRTEQPGLLPLAACQCWGQGGGDPPPPLREHESVFHTSFLPLTAGASPSLQVVRSERVVRSISCSGNL